MMNKLRKDTMESLPPSSSSSFPICGEARMRFKHQILLQDYIDLVKETDAKKMKLQQTVQKKLKLQAEVKFLRKKLKSFMKKQSQGTASSLKMPKKKPLSAQPQTAVEVRKVPNVDANRRSRNTEIPRATAVFDLNKISPSNAKALQREVAMDDFRQPVYQVSGNSSTHGNSGRRSSWQDQEALRV